jgi:uncharacterized protein YjbI with pentapeptide repeats
MRWPSIAATTLLVLALIVGVLGQVVHERGQLSFTSSVDAFYANLATELVGLAISVLIFDRLADRRLRLQQRGRATRQLRSTDPRFAADALEELRVEGWLFDGSLNAAQLQRSQLYDADMKRARLTRADFSGASLGRSSFRECLARGAIFQSAELNGADFADADVEGADFCAAALAGASFRGANTRRVKLERANLERSDWRGAHLLEIVAPGTTWECADLSNALVVRATLPRCNMVSVELTGTLFCGSDLTRTSLHSAWGQGANFDRATAIEADLTECRLRRAVFSGANLTGAKASRTELTECDFRGAILQGADFSKARLRGSDLRSAKVEGANFSHADLSECDLRGVDFGDATMLGATFTNARFD